MRHSISILEIGQACAAVHSCGRRNRSPAPLLQKVVHGIEAISVVPNTVSPIRLESKSSKARPSLQVKILNRVHDGLFEYEQTGSSSRHYLGVGCSKEGEKPRAPTKITWEQSFKWKPASHNTVDFMVTFQRNDDGAEDGNGLKSGRTTSCRVWQYKTMVLRVGFDERKHGFLNLMLNVLEDTLPEEGNTEDGEGYKPVQFYPTNPSMHRQAFVIAI